MAEAADLRVLTCAYRQWRFTRQLLRIIMDQAARVNQMNWERRQDVENIFGRWLQTMQQYNREQLHPRFPLFPSQPSDDERSWEELKRMLRNFGMNQDQAEGLASNMLTRITEFLAANSELNAVDNIEVQFEEDHEHPENGGQIVVAEFSSERCPRVSSLVHHFGELNTALVCLLYAPLDFYRGGESGMSVRALNILHDIGDATREGFASPLNCRLLGRPDIEFCSLFADTDAAYGSLGNFFSVNLSDYPGGWILNPPFVEPVMEETATRVLDVLQDAERGSFWFYITFPMWDDNKGWQMLDQSELKVARIDFRRNSFLQQDAYGAVFRPNVSLCIFVLGQLPENVDLIHLRNRLSENVGEGIIMADWLEACDIEV